MRIGLDLDEVVYDFLGQFRTYLTNRLQDDFPEPKSWSLSDEWGLSREEIDRHLEEAISWGLFFDGDPIDGARAGVNALKSSGHTIHIVTHREHYKKRAKVAHDTLSWLDNHGIPFDTITFAKDKTILDVDVLVDDNLDNYHAAVREGRSAIIFNQDWNQDSSIPEHSRAYWWGDVVQMIKESIDAT